MFNAEFGAHYHAGAKAETTSADVQLKINKDGFCIHHPDVQVEKKGMFRTKRTECYRCKEEWEIRMKQGKTKIRQRFYSTSYGFSIYFYSNAGKQLK